MTDLRKEHLRANSPLNLGSETRFVFVTGGVVSGLGKGITISSIGRLLKAGGLTVTSIKVDPYLNTDAGTMSPFEHGEAFVLNDGGETDLDLGNYERFLDVELTRDHNITTGKVYSSVIEKERRGDYLGKTVQVVPHITNEIQEWIARVAQIPVDGTDRQPDVCLVEVGGTVGDIESMVFLEAIRQFQHRVGRDRCCLVHVSLVPVLGSVGEQKTKPTQHGVKELMSLGLQPDILVCRSSHVVEPATRKKISAFCHVPPSCVMSVHDVSNIYHVPLILQEQNLHLILCESLGLLARFNQTLDLENWTKLAHTVDNATEDVVIALVGKYTNLHDAYLSVTKALRHSALAEAKNLVISWIESSHLEDSCRTENETKFNDAWKMLREADGILVPGGFGERGTEGMILAVNYARTECVPCLGVCLGMQVMVMEYARNLCGIEGATSEEFDENAKNKVIIKMLEHHGGDMGGTMRLGARDTILHDMRPEDEQPQTTASLIYNEKKSVSERHRHRYEVNPEHIGKIEDAGLRFTGKDDANERMEIVELPRKVHPYYFGVQYHPELKSRPERPAPTFHALIIAACGNFAKHYGIELPEYKTKKVKGKRLATPRASELNQASGAPGVGKVKRPRVFSDQPSEEK